MDSADNGQGKGSPPKKRSMTSVTLGWLADRLRRTEQIKEELSSGKYQVDSDRVAASIANTEE